MKPLTIGRGNKLPKKRQKYPLHAMQVGEDFFIPGYTTQKAQSLGGTISHYRKSNPDREFTNRKDEQDGVVGIRVTRIK
jgi:hypothetical protein